MELNVAGGKLDLAALRGWLAETFGEEIAAFRHRLMVHEGSATTCISILGGSDRPFIRVASVVVEQPRVDDALMHFLLTANESSTLYGAFSIDEDQDVWFSYRMPAEAVTPESLRRVVLSVAKTADEYDDLIVGRWGGHRSIEPGR